jgi:hypothetical protein
VSRAALKFSNGCARPGFLRNAPLCCIAFAKAVVPLSLRRMPCGASGGPVEVPPESSSGMDTVLPQTACLLRFVLPAPAPSARDRIQHPAARTVGACFGSMTRPGRIPCCGI